MRVFPVVPTQQQQPRVRTNETYDTLMKRLKRDKSLNYNELRDRCRGHVSPCILRELSYFDVGTSFLSDSLHNIYHGVVVRISQFVVITSRYSNFIWPMMRAILNILLSNFSIYFFSSLSFRSGSSVYGLTKSTEKSRGVFVAKKISLIDISPQ